MPSQSSVGVTMQDKFSCMTTKIHLVIASQKIQRKYKRCVKIGHKIKLWTLTFENIRDHESTGMNDCFGKTRYNLKFLLIKL